MSSFNVESGTIIDDFIQVDEVLGRGGMGLVFKATHLALGRKMALKVLDPGIVTDSQFRNRFKREAQALSRLTHPNIVAFYNFGLWQGTIPYLAMELLKGESLDSTLAENNKLPAQRIRHIATQIADALDFAHSHGIIHRDLKPSNLMLTDEPAADTVKILDFGLARLDLASLPGAQKLTSTGSLLGTVLYMSPEQSRGEKVDERTDIYSLGCIIYEMLTGKPPFDAENAIAIMMKQQNEEPAAIPAAILEQGLDYQQLAGIALKCMAKKPVHRYKNMSALRSDLKELGGQISAPSITKQTANSHKMRKLLILVSCMVLLFFSVGVWKLDEIQIFLQAQLLRSFASDKTTWTQSVQMARQMKKKHPHETAALLGATLVAAEKGSAPGLDLGKIKLEMAETLLEMKQDVDATLYATLALEDFAAAANSNTDWVLLESAELSEDTRKALDLLLQIPNKKVEKTTGTFKETIQSLFRKFEEHNDHETLILLAKLMLELELQAERRGQSLPVLKSQRLLAKCFADAGLKSDALSELNKSFNKAVKDSCTLDAAFAFNQRVQLLNESELKSQKPMLMEMQQRLVQAFNDDKPSQFPLHRQRFSSELAGALIRLQEFEQARKWLLKAVEYSREPENDLPSVQYVEYGVLADLYAKLGDRKEEKKCRLTALAALRRLPSDSSGFPFQVYISNLDAMQSLGLRNEVEAEFDKLADKFSGKSFCDLGPILYFVCRNLKEPDKSVFYSDRLIASRRKGKDNVALVLAMESKYLTLSKLGRDKEALEVILDAVHAKLDNSVEVCKRKSSCLWTAVVLLLSQDRLNEAKQLIQESVPPPEASSSEARNLVQWCQLLIFAREGKTKEYFALKKGLEGKAKNKDEEWNWKTWFNLSEADMLVTQNKLSEAQALLAKKKILSSCWRLLGPEQIHCECGDTFAGQSACSGTEQQLNSSLNH